MKLSELSGVGAIMFVAMAGTASADVTYGPQLVAACNCDITVQVPGAQFTEPSPLPFSLVNLGTNAGNLTGLTATINNPDPSISSIVFGTPSVASVPPSGLYSGSNLDFNTSPFGGSGTTTTPINNYLVAGDNGGTVTINYTTSQTALDLLWGTVDTDGSPGAQNQIVTFLAGSNTITGADINTAITQATGGLSSLTSGVFDVAVEITGLSSFKQLVASDNDSAHPAFEFVPGIVPAPPIGHGLAAVLAVCGGLFVFKLWERSKKRSPLETAAAHAAA